MLTKDCMKFFFIDQGLHLIFSLFNSIFFIGIITTVLYRMHNFLNAIGESWERVPSSFSLFAPGPVCVISPCVYNWCIVLLL